MLEQSVSLISTMREPQPELHTMRSHGRALAKKHLHDWLILILLMAIVIVLDIIHPFYRFVGKDMMTDLKYPLKENTIPFWAVPVFAILFPIVIFLFFYFRKRDVYDLHHATLGILYAGLITAVITGVIKDAVGRPRPNFFWRCFPDGKEVYNKFGGVVCHGDKNVVNEGHKSFPSGHTSCAFAGLGFLSFYLAGKIRAFDHKGHVAKLCIVVLPLLIACLVGISRVDDYWHHWQDVFVGGLIGFVVASFCYLYFFLPPNHVDGWRTYAYLKVMEEIARRHVIGNTETRNGLDIDNQLENQQRERNHGSFTGVSLSSSSRAAAAEDIESGRRYQ